MGAVVSLLALAGAIALALDGRQPRLRPSPSLFLVGLLIGVSAVRSIHPDRTVQSLLLLVSYVVAAVLAMHAVREVPRAASALLWSISVSGVLVTLGGVGQIVLGKDAGFYAGTLTGSFGYPNAAAGFLLLASGSSLAEMGRRGPILRRAAMGTAILSVLGLALTRSHGAMLAGLIGFGLWAVVDRRAWWPHRWLWAGGGGLALFLVALFKSTWLMSFPARLASLADPRLADTSFVWRLHILEWTWAMVRDHPWLGVGPGAFPVALLHYQRLPYVSGINPHNLYLEIAAEYGVPAALVFAAAFGIVIFRTAVMALRLPTADPMRRRLAALAGTLAAFGVHSAVDMDWSFPAIALEAATILGVAIGLQGSPQESASPRQPFWRGALFTVFLAAGFLGLTRYYATTLITMADAALTAGDAATAKARLTWALRFNPWSFSGRRMLVQAYFGLGDTPGAVVIAERAAAIAPEDPNGHYLAGEAAMAAGSWDAADAHLRTAVELAPSAQLRFHAAAVEVAIRRGLSGEARSRYDRAVRIFNPNRVLDTEARCLAPGDRYLLARMMRLGSGLYAETGSSDQARIMMDQAAALARPDPRGICATGGRPGQTSPEAALQSFWQALSRDGWPAAERYLLPGVRTETPGWDMRSAESESHPRPLQVAWIAGLNGGEWWVRLTAEIEFEPAPGRWLMRCARTDVRRIGPDWFLEYPPRLGPTPCAVWR